MKKIFLFLSFTTLLQICFAQRNCPAKVTQAWYVLNGQTIKNVYPPREGVSMYTINITGNGLENIKLLQTEDMLGLSKLETVSGVFRWAVQFKANSSRSISTIVFFNKCSCTAEAFKIVDDVFLWNTNTDNGGRDN